MDWIQITGMVVTGLATFVALAYNNAKAVKRVEKNEEGQYELKLNESYFWSGLICILIVVATIASSIVFYEDGVFLPAAYLVLFFGGIGIPASMSYFNHKLIFDDRFISVNNWRGEVSTIEWEEIESITFSKIFSYLKIKTKGDKLNINIDMVGFIAFLEMMELKTKFRKKDLKLPF